MAIPTCPKCSNTSFEMVEFTPRNSTFKLNSIQCESCGAVVGVMDYCNIGGMLETLAAKLRVGSLM
jgi:hypothetical protein